MGLDLKNSNINNSELDSIKAERVPDVVSDFDVPIDVLSWSAITKLNCPVIESKLVVTVGAFGYHIRNPTTFQFSAITSDFRETYVLRWQIFLCFLHRREALFNVHEIDV